MAAISCFKMGSCASYLWFLDRQNKLEVVLLIANGYGGVDCDGDDGEGDGGDDGDGAAAAAAVISENLLRYLLNSL